MKHSTITAIAGASVIAISSPLLAQQQPAQPQPAPPPAPGAQQAEVSQAEVRKFAEIYVDIEETRTELSQEMSEAENQQEAQEIQVRMQEKFVATIEDHGWSTAQYNQVASAISNDPQLREQALSLIAEIG